MLHVQKIEYLLQLLIRTEEDFQKIMCICDSKGHFFYSSTFRTIWQAPFANDHFSHEALQHVQHVDLGSEMG